LPLVRSVTAASTWISELASRSLWAATSALGRKRSLSWKRICRWRLEVSMISRSMRSRSMRVRSPTPARASQPAMTEPVAPTPTTATLRVRSRASAGAPRKIRCLAYRSDIPPS